MEVVKTILAYAWEGIKYIDWLLYILAGIWAFFVAKDFWFFWREETYKHAMKWITLEIKVPREVLKGPKAMEQFFASVFALQNRPESWGKEWWKGEQTRWHIFEVIGTSQAVRFYLRTHASLRQAVEAMLYAQYNDLEIVSAPDYVQTEMPATYDELSAQGYEIFGNELEQAKSPGIAIRTYSEFEQESGDEKGRIIDPISVLLELVGNLKPEEKLLIQFVLQPDRHRHWQHDAEHMLEKIRDTSQQVGVDSEGKPQIRFRFRSPGEEGVIKRIEDKKERPAFVTVIRYMYVAPKSIYNYNIGYRGVQTFFNQFRHDYQSLDRNFDVITKGEWYYFPFLFPDKRLKERRKRFYKEFVERFLPELTFAGRLFNRNFWVWCFGHRLMYLSTEELATILHIPTNVVLTQSTMERIESKRLSSPTNIPT